MSLLFESWLFTVTTATNSQRCLGTDLFVESIIKGSRRSCWLRLISPMTKPTPWPKVLKRQRETPKRLKHSKEVGSDPHSSPNNSCQSPERSYEAQSLVIHSVLFLLFLVLLLCWLCSSLGLAYPSKVNGVHHTYKKAHELCRTRFNSAACRRPIGHVLPLPPNPITLMSPLMMS